MATIQHEELVELFRADPTLAVDLLCSVPGMKLPAYDRIEVRPGEMRDLVPLEYRADVVVLLVKDKPVYAIVLEVQLCEDWDKWVAWPLYQAVGRARFGCKCCLLVYAPDPKIAAWCARPIDTGQPGSPFKPLVRGPTEIPVIKDAAVAAKAPYRAVLSVVAHGKEPGAEEIARAALEGIAGLAGDERATWEEVILTALDEAARRALEAWMNLQGYPEKSRFFQQGEERGQAKGEADALLDILDVRGLMVPDDLRARVLACADIKRLKTWVRRAVTADRIEAVFDEDAGR